MREKLQLDDILSIVENPIRRKIIEKLSQEPSYPLELAREIGAGQQLITNHLNMMERGGIVVAKLMASPIGPKRKLYHLKKAKYLTISFGPHLYQEQMLTFNDLPSKLSETHKELFNKITGMQLNKNRTIRPLSELISEIDDKLSELEREKTTLLHLRNLVMEETNLTLKNLRKSHDEKRVLYHMINKKNNDVEDISKSLNLREYKIRELITELKKDFPELYNKL